jgi:hypothetical protein
MEGKVCSQEGQEPPPNECCRQEEIVDADEETLGSEEKCEGFLDKSPILKKGFTNLVVAGRRAAGPI